MTSKNFDFIFDFRNHDFFKYRGHIIFCLTLRSFENNPGKK